MSSLCFMLCNFTLTMSLLLVYVSWICQRWGYSYWSKAETASLSSTHNLFCCCGTKINLFHWRFLFGVFCFLFFGLLLWAFQVSVKLTVMFLLLQSFLPPWKWIAFFFPLTFCNKKCIPLQKNSAEYVGVPSSSIFEFIFYNLECNWENLMHIIFILKGPKKTWGEQ